MRTLAMAWMLVWAAIPSALAQHDEVESVPAIAQPLLQDSTSSTSPSPSLADDEGQEMTLDAILAYADEHAPALQVARAQLSFGDAEMAGATPLLKANPVLSVGAGPGFNRISRETVTHVDFTASLSQRVDVSGKRETRIAAARHAENRLRAELEEARWAVHREVHDTFHQALVARERLRAADRLLLFQQRLLNIAKQRLQAGDVSQLAVRLAEGELSQAQVSRIAAEQVHTQRRIQLGAIIGWSTSTPPKPSGLLDQPREVPTIVQLMEMARLHQPRRRTLQARADEAKARVAAADREAFPEPTVGINLMRESFRLGPPETQILGIISMPIPFFHRNQGPRQQARASVTVAEAEQLAFDAQLRARLELYRSAVESSAAQLRTYGTEILPKFEENLRLLQRAFELGEIDILEVSVARERFLRLQADVLDAYMNYFQAVANLEQSIGADLWPHVHEEQISEPAAQGGSS